MHNRSYNTNKRPEIKYQITGELNILQGIVSFVRKNKQSSKENYQIKNKKRCKIET